MACNESSQAKPRSPYKALFEPFCLGPLRLKNRIISTSHAPAYAEDGMPGERYQRYHEEKAKGGLALTMFGGASSVSRDSPPSFGQLQLGEDRVIPHLRAFADRIHAHDVGLICQISHAGRRTRPTAGNWLPTLAPSPLREPAHGAVPKALEMAEIRRITGDYAAAALRCAEGGLDGVELLVSGHLIGQFWSPLSNQRTDAYGGSLENRMRFGLEVLEAIREATPARFIVSLRFTANEFVEGGIDEAEGLAIAVAHARTGLINCLNVSGGANWTKAGVAETVPSMAFASGRFIELAGKVRRATGLPVLHAAGVADLATAHHAVAEGHVDLIGMTRAQIADPHMVSKHLAGEDGAIRPCVGAGYCIDRIYRGGDAFCLHNPVTGRESALSHRLGPSTRALQTVVVGAGPAGLEAARTLAERGHRVQVLEALDRPGGQVAYA
ncbi:MAG: NAD(P)-binding protein, partial [Pseudomonadota bacterium]